MYKNCANPEPYRPEQAKGLVSGDFSACPAFLNEDEATVHLPCIGIFDGQMERRPASRRNPEHRDWAGPARSSPPRLPRKPKNGSGDKTPCFA